MDVVEQFGQAQGWGRESGLRVPDSGRDPGRETVSECSPRIL